MYAIPQSEYGWSKLFFHGQSGRPGSHLLLENIAVLRHAVRKVWQSHPFEIIAMVVLPDHLHAIWCLPDGDADFPLRWSLIKATFSREIPKNEIIRRSRILKRERGIWQRRYWEHQIMDDDDLEKHVACIHNNPVKHGYVTRASDWPNSSIHREIARGNVDENWAYLAELENEAIGGERLRT